MDKKNFSGPIRLQNIQVTDDFWHREMELVRKEVIPYQWDALNDNVKDAAPSYCMHNFRAASKLVKNKALAGRDYVAPKYTYRGFEALPDDPKNPDDDKFYGFVFQDTDFSKWIEAVAYSLSSTPDKELEKIADDAIDLVCSAQLENGYLDTYYILNGMDASFKNLRDNHELYCLGHLIEGAVAYYDATGKDKLLKAACRFADYVYDIFGTEDGKCKGYPGHEIAEMALVRLYEVTGNEKYKELSNYFINQRGQQPYYFETETMRENPVPTNQKYHQSHMPVREQDEAVGHAVRAVYLYSGMADNARLYQDQKLYEACERLWDNIVKKKMYITGGIGGTHLGESFSFEYDLPNDTAYAETCASIGMVFFARRMLEISANSKYADVMELELFNGVLSGMALDGKSFFYVNPLEVFPKACHEDERKFHVKPIRQKWFGCACCPPNIARLLSSIGSYGFTSNDETFFCHLYMGAKIKDNNMNITIDSNMPWDGKISISVTCEEETSREIALRIPGWTTLSDSSVTVNGEKILFNGNVGNDCYIKDGYLFIKRNWQSDVIDIDFPMPIKCFCSNSAVRENYGKVAFKRGPVVYCAEEIDNGTDLHMLKVNPQIDKITISEENYLGHKSINLHTTGTRADDIQSEDLYCEYSKPVVKEINITLVPYYSWNNRGEGEMIVWINS